MLELNTKTALLILKSHHSQYSGIQFVKVLPCTSLYDFCFWKQTQSLPRGKATKLSSYFTKESCISGS